MQTLTSGRTGATPSYVTPTECSMLDLGDTELPEPAELGDSRATLWCLGNGGGWEERDGVPCGTRIRINSS